MKANELETTSRSMSPVVGDGGPMMGHRNKRGLKARDRARRTRVIIALRVGNGSENAVDPVTAMR